MRLIVAGGRDYRLTAEDESRLDALAEELVGYGDPIKLVITGGAPGADWLAHRWALSRRIQTAVFEANWAGHGKSAGPIRNRAMAENANAVVLFTGGKGTENMAEEARKAGLTIYDWRGQ